MTDTLRHCPGCQNPVDQSDRFCRCCGVFLESQAREHRYVTILFSDLTNYTMLSERLDPEDLKNLMDRIFGRASLIITRYGGMLEKFIGDAIVALFGAFEVHEDDVIRAIHAAQETHAFVAGLRPMADPGLQLNMHTGIYTGTILMSNVNEQIPHGSMGIPFTVAARLSALAAPGEILIGESSRFEAERQFNLISQGNKEVKGLKESLSVYRVLKERDIPLSVRRNQALESKFVGRESDLADLLAQIEAYRHGQCGIVWLRGEAGIGKSRLMHELRGHIPADISWHEARCLEYARYQPYFPIQALMRQFASTISGSPLDLEDLRHAFEIRDIPNPEAYRHHIYAYIRTLIAQTGSRVIICIEDMQWADPSSLDLLSFLSVSKNTQGGLLALLTSREEPPPGFSCEKIVLSELSYAEIKDMVLGLLPVGINEPSLNHIYHATGGNPLYVEEMVRYIMDKGDETIKSAPVPLTLKGLMCARFDRLSPGAKRVLKNAAVLGIDFTTSTLNYIDSLMNHEHIEELLKAGIILPDNSGQGAYAFRHALTRDAAYEDLVKQERIDLHGQVGKALEKISSPEQSDVLAYHYKQAQDYPKAYRFSLQSAQRCQESGSWMEAAAHYRNSEQALYQIPEDNHKMPSLVWIWEGMWSCSRIFNPDLAIHALKNLTQTHETLQQFSDMAFAQVRLINLYAQKACFADALSVFKEVLVHTSHDPRMRSAAETSLAYVFTYLGNPRIALHYLEISRNAFDEGDIFLRAVNSLMTLASYVWKGCIPEALTWYQLTRTLTKGNLDMELLADVWLGYINFLAGNYTHGETIFTRIAEAEQILGAMAGALSYLRTQSSIYVMTCYLNRPERARQDFETFSRWCGSMQAEGTSSLMDLYQGWIAQAEGRLDTARDHLERSLPGLEAGFANRVPYALNALAQVLLKQHEIDQARTIILKSLAWNRAHGNQEQLITGLRLRGELSIMSGELELALSSLSEGERLARNLYMRPQVVWISELYEKFLKKKSQRKLMIQTLRSTLQTSPAVIDSQDQRFTELEF